ncbi:MAG: GvpL/GvpF family gas vesicle protein [Chloroflexi bacterium]|nr:GvpL/GvpF family gas vesicle protein [Chloroflexota bacterium]
MTYAGKYLYCIIRGPGEHIFDDIAPIGNTNNPVHTISHNGLAVVVSDSADRDYETSRARMLAHERVQERVMRDFPLLPVRFGTVTRDFASAMPDLNQLLETRSHEFDHLLAEMEGKVELGLKALWRDEKALFEEIVAENLAIRRFRNSVEGKPPQAIHFEKIHLGQMVKDALDRKRRLEATHLLAPLRSLAHSVKENEVILDRMVFNVAFLMDQAMEREMDEAVKRLSDEWENRIELKYTGPNPPWNFVEIVVNWGAP